MANPSQISATISVATKDRLDRFAESHGFKKNFVVEQALLFFMEARSNLPDEALLPVRITLDDDDFDILTQQLDEQRGPNDKLRELMRASND